MSDFDHTDIIEERRTTLKQVHKILRIVLIPLFVILFVIILVVVKKDRQRQLNEYIAYLTEYCDKNYPDRYYLDSSEDVLYVHLWQPGTALYIASKPGTGELEVREKFEPLAKRMYESMGSKGLNYGVALVLHSDIDTERILMMWADGKLVDVSK